MSGEGSIQGAAVTAISGIDVALHDLAGEILAVPEEPGLGVTLDTDAVEEHVVADEELSDDA